MSKKGHLIEKMFSIHQQKKIQQKYFKIHQIFIKMPWTKMTKHFIKAKQFITKPLNIAIEKTSIYQKPRMKLSTFRSEEYTRFEKKKNGKNPQIRQPQWE